MHSLTQLSQHYPKRQSNEVLRTVPLMGPFVTIHVAGHEGDSGQTMRNEAVDRAFEWFRRVEDCCTRFEPHSEVMQLANQAGVPVQVSTILYQAVQFALAVAE